MKIAKRMEHIKPAEALPNELPAAQVNLILLVKAPPLPTALCPGVGFVR